MKKKVFREKYNIIDGAGEIIKEGLTIDEIKSIPVEADPVAETVKVKAVKKTTRKKKVEK